jgi:hypothetical protein
LSELSFVRIYDFNLIPKSIFKELSRRDFLSYDDKDLERLYLYGQLVAQDKLTQVYAMVDDDKVIRGVLWLSIDPIILWLYVVLCVVDKKFQNYKKNITRIVGFSRKIQKDLGLKGVRALTPTPGAYIKMFGAKKSKLTVVEVN